MRDYRKFCRPRAAKSPKTGDVIVKLNCGEEVIVNEKEYNSIKKFFKVKSLVGSSNASNQSGFIRAISKETGLEATFSPEVYNTIKDNFEISGIIGAKNISDQIVGDIICHNSILNSDATFNYEDWLNLDNDWKATGINGVTTIEEENTVGGEYIIMANGTTFIVSAEDYAKIDTQWEHIDTIQVETTPEEP